MNLDPNYLLASFVVSGVGFVLFTYGRKERRLPHAAIGVLMLVYPYFLSSVSWMLGWFALLCALLFGLMRLGV
jgi:hypothetical protein